MNPGLRGGALAGEGVIVYGTVVWVVFPRCGGVLAAVVASASNWVMWLIQSG